MIKYLGSKSKLLDTISSIVADLVEPGAKVADPFCGSAKVSKRFREDGYRVIGSDMNSAPALLAKTVLEYSPEQQPDLDAFVRKMVAEAESYDGYFTETFCKSAMFFQPHNGRLVDGYRRWLTEHSTDPMYAPALASLLTSLDKYDNTCGVQMAYLKKWCARSKKTLEVTPVQLVDGPSGLGMQKRWEDNAFLFDGTVDLVYLDTPYNQHNYRANYHIWETLVRGDEPATYGKAMKRMDCKTVKSDFNSKRRAEDAMAKLVRSLVTKYIVVSFSNEGFVSREVMESLLSERGRVTVHTKEHDRYVGARIGIHDLDGNKAGKVSHTKNKEFIYVCEID